MDEGCIGRERYMASFMDQFLEMIYLACMN